MDNMSAELIGPDIIRRVRGGVIAVSHRNVGIRLGVIAENEEIARSEFAALVRRWMDARQKELSHQATH